MPSTWWPIAPSTDIHQWFPLLCDVQDNSLDIINPQRVMLGWKGPFALDSAIIAIWRVRKWRLQISAVQDLGGGSTVVINEDRVLDTFCTYLNSTNPTDVPLADESWLNFDDLENRVCRVDDTNIQISFLHPTTAVQNPNPPFYPEGQVHYNTGAVAGAPGYYLNARFVLFSFATIDFDFISATGTLPSTRQAEGVYLTWNTGGESITLQASRATPNPPDGITYSGSVNIFPESYWPYIGPLGPTYDELTGDQLVDPLLNKPIQI